MPGRSRRSRPEPGAAVAHLRGARNGPFKGLLRGLGVAAEAHGDIGDKADPQASGVKHRPIPFDHPRPLKRLHPTQAGRGRQVDPLGEVDIGQAAVGLSWPES